MACSKMQVMDQRRGQLPQGRRLGRARTHSRRRRTRGRPAPPQHLHPEGEPALNTVAAEQGLPAAHAPCQKPSRPQPRAPPHGTCLAKPGCRHLCLSILEGQPLFHAWRVAPLPSSSPACLCGAMSCHVLRSQGARISARWPWPVGTTIWCWCRWQWGQWQRQRQRRGRGGAWLGRSASASWRGIDLRCAGRESCVACPAVAAALIVAAGRW